MSENMWALDDNYDVYLDTTGNIAAATTTSHVLSQRITYTLKTFQGEVFLDRSAGVPYYEEVLKKNPDVARIRALLLSKVQGVFGVDKILAFSVEFNPSQRLFKVDFTVKAVDGTIVSGGI